MARGMKTVAALSVFFCALFVIINQIKPNSVCFSLAITAGTIAYHLLMRLIVGHIYNFLLENRVDYNKKWFEVGFRERRLYKLLRVKEWKRFMPTYDPAVFDKKQHSWEEIASATCQSELVHETIIPLSFLPIVSSIWFGEPLVFLLTSVFSALFDLSFVIMQRYNRPRVLKMIKRKD